MQPDSRSDHDLVEALNRGEVAAFEVLYARHRDWVVRLAFRFTRDHHDALDVLQETFTWFLDRFPGFHLTARLSTFLYPVVRNLSIAVLRRRRRLVSDDDLLAVVPAPEEGATSEPYPEDLSRVLGRLSAPQREVLLMRFLDGMSLQEIALALELPLGTVKSRLHNALAILREDPGTRDYFLGE